MILFSPVTTLSSPATLVLPQLGSDPFSDVLSQLYLHGRLDAAGAPNILVLILVRLIAAALILLAAWVAAGLIRRALHRSIHAISKHGSGGEQRRLTTLQGLLSSTISYGIYFVAFIFVLVTFGLSWKGLAPLLGAASVVGLAIGFGAQKLVRDVITGLFILAEGQFDVGDWVTIGTVTGRVEDMALRVTRLRDDQGRLYIVANGDITQVFNASRGMMKLQFSLSLHDLSRIDTAIDMIRNHALETLAEFRVAIAPGQELSVLVTDMDAGKVTVRVTLWVPVADKDRIEDTLRRRLLAILGTEASLLA